MSARDDEMIPTRGPSDACADDVLKYNIRRHIYTPTHTHITRALIIKKKKKDNESDFVLSSRRVSFVGCRGTVRFFLWYKLEPLLSCYI